MSSGQQKTFLEVIGDYLQDYADQKQNQNEIAQKRSTYTLYEDLLLIYEYVSEEQSKKGPKFLEKLVQDAVFHRSSESLRSRYRDFLRFLTRENFEQIIQFLEVNGIQKGYLRFEVQPDKSKKLIDISLEDFNKNKLTNYQQNKKSESKQNGHVQKPNDKQKDEKLHQLSRKKNRLEQLAEDGQVVDIQGVPVKRRDRDASSEEVEQQLQDGEKAQKKQKKSSSHPNNEDKPQVIEKRQISEEKEKQQNRPNKAELKNHQKKVKNISTLEELFEEEEMDIEEEIEEDIENIEDDIAKFGRKVIEVLHTDKNQQAQSNGKANSKQQSDNQPKALQAQLKAPQKPSAQLPQQLKQQPASSKAQKPGAHHQTNEQLSKQIIEMKQKQEQKNRHDQEQKQAQLLKQQQKQHEQQLREQQLNEQQQLMQEQARLQAQQQAAQMQQESKAQQQVLDQLLEQQKQQLQQQQQQIQQRSRSLLQQQQRGSGPQVDRVAHGFQSEKIQKLQEQYRSQQQREEESERKKRQQLQEQQSHLLHQQQQLFNGQGYLPLHFMENIMRENNKFSLNDIFSQLNSIHQSIELTQKQELLNSLKQTNLKLLTDFTQKNKRQVMLQNVQVNQLTQLIEELSEKYQIEQIEIMSMLESVSGNIQQLLEILENPEKKEQLAWEDFEDQQLKNIKNKNDGGYKMLLKLKGGPEALKQRCDFLGVQLPFEY